MGFFVVSWVSSAISYGLPDGSAGGFFGLGAQPSGQGQLYKDMVNFINTARGLTAFDSEYEAVQTAPATSAVVGGSVGGVVAVGFAVAAIVYRRRQSRAETPDSIIMASPSIVLVEAQSPNPSFNPSGEKRSVMDYLRTSLGRVSLKRASSDSNRDHRKQPSPSDLTSSPLQTANPVFKNELSSMGQVEV